MSIVSSVLTGSGISPIRFEKRMKKNEVASHGNQRMARLLSRLSFVICPSTRSKASSTVIWVRFGFCCILRATPTMIAIVTTTASQR